MLLTVPVVINNSCNRWQKQRTITMQSSLVSELDAGRWIGRFLVRLFSKQDNWDRARLISNSLIQVEMEPLILEQISASATYVLTVYARVGTPSYIGINLWNLKQNLASITSIINYYSVHYFINRHSWNFPSSIVKKTWEYYDRDEYLTTQVLQFTLVPVATMSGTNILVT